MINEVCRRRPEATGRTSFETGQWHEDAVLRRLVVPGVRDTAHVVGPPPGGAHFETICVTSPDLAAVFTSDAGI